MPVDNQMAASCPVAGCGVIEGQPYAGMPPCLQPWSGDPKAAADYLRGCLRKRTAEEAGTVRHADDLDGLPPELIAELSQKARGEVRGYLAPALGQLQGDKLRVAVSFDSECFRRIRSIAKKRRISFGNAVRSLVEIGLQVQDRRDNRPQDAS